MWPLVWIMPNIKLAIRSFSYFSEDKFCTYQGFKEILNSVKLLSKKCLWYNLKKTFSDIKVYLVCQYLLGEKFSEPRHSPTNQM